jgi:hypothetical protein
LFSSWYSHDKPEYFQEIGRNNITEVFAVEWHTGLAKSS